MDRLAYREGSKEWVDFLLYWGRDPIGMVKLCGHALGQNAIYTEDFFYAFGRSLFDHWQVLSRIDFLYTHPDAQPELSRREDFSDTVALGLTDQVPWIIDVDGQYGYLGIALFRNLDIEQNVYAIRTFLPEIYKIEPPDTSWNGPLDVFDGIVGRTLETGEHSCQNFVEHGHSFWNFSRDPDNRIGLPVRSDGFQDIKTTKRVAHMLLWTTNMLGFHV